MVALGLSGFIAVSNSLFETCIEKLGEFYKFERRT